MSKSASSERGSKGEPRSSLQLPLDLQKARAAYLARVRHDLRTPINHILGYCEMLQEEADAPSWTNFRPDLDKIHQGGERLLGLVNYYFDGSDARFEKLDV